MINPELCSLTVTEGSMDHDLREVLVRRRKLLPAKQMTMMTSGVTPKREQMPICRRSQL